MLQNIRDNLQGVMAKVIIGIIIVPFAAFGIDSLLGGSGSQDAIIINGEDVSESEVQQAIQLQKRQLLSQMGEDIDYTKLEDNLLRKPAMEALIQQKVLLQQAESEKFHVSEQQLDKLILQVEDFQENGQFSPALYENLLRSNGMTPLYYKKLLKKELLIGDFSSAYSRGGFITDKELELAGRFIEQKRDIRYLTIPIKSIEENVTVSDDEIQTYYEDNSQQFFSDESVVLEYIEIKRSDFYEPVDEKEIRAQYEAEISAMEDAGANRRIAHILVQIDDDTSEAEARKKISDIKQKIAEGEDFAQLAKEFSEDVGSKNNGGDLGFSRGDVFPEAIEEAITELEVNGITEAIKTDAGLHLVKLTAIQKSSLPSYEESRERILVEIQKSSSEIDYVAKVEQLADLSFNSPDLTGPAKELGVALETSEELTRGGAQEGLFSDSRLISAAYSNEVLTNRHNSELIELSDEHAVVLRIKQHNPSELQPLEAVKEEVVAKVKLRKAKDIIAEKSQKLLAELQAGANIQILANKNNLQWQVTPSAIRNSGGVDRQVLERAFELPVPGEAKQSIDMLTLNNGNVVLLSVSNVKDGKLSDMEAEQRESMKTYLGRNDGYQAFDLYQKAITDKAEVKVL
jgi:peptidyl-prolyl cis-trans isomerase D